MLLDEDWSADIAAERMPSGKFAAVLTLTPPSEVGPPIRYRVPGDYDSTEAAEWAALDAFAAMTRN